MPTDLQNTINGPLGISIALMIGRYTPNRIGLPLVKHAADLISGRRNTKMVRSVRLNQWVVRGENLSRSALDDAVRENFRSTARSIFDLYHNINNPSVFRKMIDIHPVAEQLMTRPEFTDRGLLVAGLHMSNFDFIGQVAGMSGVKAIVLGMPDVHPGYRKQLEMRREKGMNILPTSSATIKQAIKYLRQGGMVMTGIDRPDETYPNRSMFCGHPAALPIHHIFMALKAQVPVLVGAVIRQTDGKYHFLFSDPIEMQPHQDRQQEIIRNAENVLQIAEGFIKQDPTQWAMAFPVWPDLMDQVPQ